MFLCVQFKAHAVAEGAGIAEDPMDITVNVIDQNDNKPVFNQSTFLGQVAEASQIGTVSGSHLSVKEMSALVKVNEQYRAPTVCP